MTGSREGISTQKSSFALNTMKKSLNFFALGLSLIAWFCLQGCATSSKTAKARSSGWKFQKERPWEYYQSARPAVYHPENKKPVQKAAIDTFGEETKGEKRAAAVIGVIAGLLAIGGLVTAIVLTR